MSSKHIDELIKNTTQSPHLKQGEIITPLVYQLITKQDNRFKIKKIGITKDDLKYLQENNIWLIRHVLVADENEKYICFTKQYEASKDKITKQFGEVIYIPIHEMIKV